MKNSKGFLSRERIITALAFSWFFTLMTGYYIIKPVRETFINELPHQFLPYIFISIMFFILMVNFIYDFLAKNLPPEKLITLVIIFFAICLFIFARGLSMEWPTVYIPYFKEVPGRYIWIVSYIFFIGIYNVFTATMFWAFINEIFTANEARNNFGRIISGGTIGGICGSKLTSYLASFMAVGNMLLFSAFFLLLTLVFMKILLQYKENNPEFDIKPEKETAEKESGFHMIGRSSYLRWILIAMFLMTSSSTFMVYQINYIVKHAILEEGKRAQFWANMYFYINVLGFTFQIFTGSIFYKIRRFQIYNINCSCCRYIRELSSSRVSHSPFCPFYSWEPFQQ